MKLNKWYVIKTPCYPKAYKVVNDFYLMDNATWRYHETELKANEEANKLNKEEFKKMGVN